MRVLFALYTVFESFSMKIHTCENNPVKSYAQTFQKQIPSSFGFYLVNNTGERLEPVTYTANADEEMGEIFVEKLTEYTKMIYEK